MGNIATTIDQQIDLLKQRGVEIEDEDKAKEMLLDIGYFRLGFYFFPFEKTYPQLANRNHQFKEGTKFSDAYSLYYLDFDLRNILLRYIARVEVAMRTFLTYYVSNKYRNDPTWFVNDTIVNHDYSAAFNEKVYKKIRVNEAIRGHHKNHPKDKYAPAWKTIEFMTFGEVITLYSNLRCTDDKLAISRHFSINQTSVFGNYLQTLRYLRNVCAHGGQIFRLTLPQTAKNGPAGTFDNNQKNKFYACVSILRYFVHQISTNRETQMMDSINEIFDLFKKNNSHLMGIVVGSSAYQR